MPKMYVTPKKKWKNDPKWDYFWLTSLSIIGLGIGYYSQAPVESKMSYFIKITIYLCLSLTFFFLSTKFHTEGYSYKKQVVSHIGRYRVHGQKNNASLAFFFLFSLFYGLEMMNIAHYLDKSQVILARSRHLDIASIFLYIGSAFAILMSLIPLDIHRWKHLISALVTFLGILIANILLTIHVFIHEKVKSWVAIFSLTSITFSALYIYGYITNTMPAIFQKMAMLSATISLYVNFIVL